ncbi:unnamed protein product [marine sediment metagenome]|uniref:Uncharacterized protein n=1 Tax=marine sediment metagenome TaxID=412755 RepID=X1IK21_9ZZZZ
MNSCVNCGTALELHSLDQKRKCIVKTCRKVIRAGKGSMMLDKIRGIKEPLQKKYMLKFYDEAYKAERREGA